MSDAARLLDFLYMGSVYRPDGLAILALCEAMSVYNMGADQVRSALNWAESKDLVIVEGSNEGVTYIALSGKGKAGQVAKRKRQTAHG